MSEVNADSYELDEDVRSLMARARSSAAANDRHGLVSAATRLWRKTKVPVNVLIGLGDDVAAELDELCDEALPGPQVSRDERNLGLADRLQLAADVLDAPWPTPRRLAALLLVAGGEVVHHRMARLDDLAEQALHTGPVPVRPRLLRLLVSSVLGFTEPETGARLLAALHELGALDIDTVEAAFTRDTSVGKGRSLGDAVFDDDRSVGTDDFRTALRNLYDEVVWRLTAAPNPDDWAVTPTSPPPRGLRFVLRGLDLSAGRLTSEPGLDPTNRYVREMVAHLCAAELTDQERSELAQVLAQRPDAERRTAREYQPLLAGAPGDTPEQPLPFLVPGVAAEVVNKSFRYRGTQLEATDDVAAALARSPETWTVVDGDDDALGPITRAQLCGYLHASTRDGQTWDLGIEVAIGEVEPVGGDVDLVEQALAAQPEVARARHAEADWYQLIVVRPLRADEVLARFIDALAAAYRASAQPRPRPRGPQPLDSAAVLALATDIAPMMAELGFSPVEPLRDRAPESVAPEYYRVGGDQLIQMVRLSSGAGEIWDDDADGWAALEGTVSVGLWIFAVTSSDPTTFLKDVNGRRHVSGVTVGQWITHGVPPTPAGLSSRFTKTCLPWFAQRHSRAAIVGQWMRAPRNGAPWPLWEKVEVAAQWGMRDEASALLRNGWMEEPQHAEKYRAVAQRFGLTVDWESLAAPTAPGRSERTT